MKTARESATLALDLLGLLLLAAGAVGGLLPLIGWSALAAGGVVVLAGAWFADRKAAPSKPGEAT